MFDGISTNNLGTADLVVNLSPYALGSNGLLVVKSAAGSGHSLAAGTTLVANSFFTQSGGFNNGTLSFYLFFSSSAFSGGADYDANDDGVLDNLPSGSQVLDDVALLDNNSSASGDKAYGAAVLSEYNSTGTPDAATRLAGNSTPSSSSAWYGGELVDTGNVAAQINYDATRESANEPAGAYLTPGAVNVPGNQPPVNTVPSNQSVIENTSLVCSTANGNAVSIADPDAGAASVQVALSVSHGGLTLGGSTGLTITAGSSGSTNLTFTGSMTDINSALNGLTYVPAAGYTGSDTLQIATNDLGNTGAGGPQTATDNVAITVVAPPLLNEIEANPPGTSDNRYEYVELRGAAAQA